MIHKAAQFGSRIRRHAAVSRYNLSGAFRRPIAYMTDIRYRHRVERLEAMRDECSGAPCVIMGNGPSLNAMDLSSFANIDVWASNRAYLLLDRLTWRPRYWVGVDRRVIPDVATELAAIHNRLPDTRFFYPDSFLGLPFGATTNIYWFREHRPQDAYDFTMDASRYVATSATVTITAIQLAVHLGYNPIYLIGCDTAYSVPATTRKEAGRPDRLTSTEDDDPNHFDPSYFGAQRRWHEPHVERMKAHYSYIAPVLGERGVTVYNATVGGQLETFPRIDYSLIPEST